MFCRNTHALLFYLVIISFATAPATRAAEIGAPVFESDSPRVVAAYAVKAKLEASDQRFVEATDSLLEALDQAIIRVPPSADETDFSYERESLVRMIQVTERLIQECDPVMAALAEHQEIGRTYYADLADAKPAFLAAAAECQSAAKTVQFTEHRDDYEAMAEIMTAMAERCDRLPQEVTAQRKAIDDLYPYLKEGRVVLMKFNTVLKAVPVLQSGEKFQALDDRLKAYAQGYERFRKSLGDLKKQLRPSAETSEVEPTSTAQWTPHRDSTIPTTTNIRFASTQQGVLRTGTGRPTPSAWTTVQNYPDRISYRESETALTIPALQSTGISRAQGSRAVLFYKISANSAVQKAYVEDGTRVQPNNVCKVRDEWGRMHTLRVIRELLIDGESRNYWHAEIVSR